MVLETCLDGALATQEMANALSDASRFQAALTKCQHQRASGHCWRSPTWHGNFQDSCADGGCARPMNTQDTLAATLAAFIREHEYCGELDTGLEDDRVWLTCTCGAVLVRVVAFG